MNINEINNRFKTQEDCIAYIEAKRWSNGIVTCPYCQSAKVSKHASKDREISRHQCSSCKKTFSALVGTIYQGTHIPLKQWFLLISLMMNAKKSLSACQAARDLGIRRTTVWKMMHKIRTSLKQDTDPLCGIIEVDETYTCKKEDEDDDENTPKPNKRGRGCNKQAIVGMIERDGKVKAVKQDKLNFESLKKLLFASINIEKSVLFTDEYRAYKPFKKHLPHFTVNHSIKQFVSGAVHTNTIESFWATLKRGIKGQFHHISVKYLNKYLDEFCYRYNMRYAKQEQVFDCVMERMLLV